MGYFEWMNKGIKKMSWYDIALVKLAVAGFILMIVNLWPPLAALDWYWYLIVAVVASIRPMSLVFR